LFTAVQQQHIRTLRLHKVKYCYYTLVPYNYTSTLLIGTTSRKVYR